MVAVRDARGIKRSADDVITHTRKVLYTAAADKHDRVLLQVVADTRNVGGYLDLVGQTNTCDLSKCRVRFLRRRSINTRANPSFLWVCLQSRAGCFVFDSLAALANQLINSRHILSVQQTSVCCSIFGKIKFAGLSKGKTNVSPDSCRTCSAVSSSSTRWLNY